nr:MULTISPECIES: oxygenase MpaB family protein [unclassified Burkholderia]
MAGITHLTAGGGGPSIDLSSPPGDPGLFGPDAVCWRVHADFTSMMTGGIAALLLQALHPLALAGVWDHSSFRTDIFGRLRRTATFITGTTFGSRADALALIERVKAIHAHISGSAPDGRPYRADDPALLTWVHVAEVSSFLAAHLRYVNPALPGELQDRYYAETALIAELLGAEAVPRSRAEVAAYLARMLPARTRSRAAHVRRDVHPAECAGREAGAAACRVAGDACRDRPAAAVGAAHAARIGVRAAAARGGPARHTCRRPRAALGARQRCVEACAPPRDGRPVRRRPARLTIRFFGSFQFTVKYL